jgi:hypothetical protein
MPKRIQMSRQKPWRADDPEAVKVDRSTRHGNPFAIGKEVVVAWDAGTATGSITAENASEAVAYFRDWMNGVVEVLGWERPPVWPLVGYDLACWCPLEDSDGTRVPCHADVLLELANGHPS